MLIYLLAALGLVPTFQKTKCKKLLNVCMERIKLLEKRRQVQVRQLHRDLIELLQLKKEHKVDPLLLRIWKELCLFSVYAKIAEYIGFVQMSLKDIAARRECPSGLEEPLAGLCFAASCCAQLPELQELREIFAMKYGKQILSSEQDLQPNCHVDQQFLDCLCSNNPAEARKQALLEDIITKHNAMLAQEQDIQPLELCDSGSIEGLVDATDCHQSKEGTDFTTNVSEVEHQSEFDIDMVQEPNCVEEDPSFLELDSEFANQKRNVDGRETSRSAPKRAYRRRTFWLNKAMEGEEIGGKKLGQTADKAQDFGMNVCGSGADKRSAGEQHGGYESCEEGINAYTHKDALPSGDLRVVRYVQQPPSSQPPQRPPPPPPPPKRAPPLLPPSLRVISMPRCVIDKEVNADTRLLFRCSTTAKDHYLEDYGSHVHPRLPKYEDLVANFTALKH